MSAAPGGRPRVVVACAADDAYAMPLAVALRSAAENLRATHGLEVFVLDGGVSPGHRAAVEHSLPAGRARLHWVAAAGDALAGARVTRGRISVATYFRILIGDLLPPELSKAIYLDADLVVCGDLAELWELELDGRVLLAARDPAVPSLGSPLGLANPRELGLAPELPYFNAGVALIDLARWRREGVAARVLRYLEEHRQDLRFWDQDGLNAVLAGRWGELEPTWNQLPQLRDWPSWPENPFGAARCQAALAAPRIVHFATWSKPWHYGCAHPERGRFFEVLDRTQFQGWRPRKRLRDARAARGWLRVQRGLRRRAAAWLRAARAGRGPSGR